MSEVVELHRRAALEFGARVHGVGATQWDLPTPCPEWDVRALVAHLVDEQLWTTPLLAGRTIDEVAPEIPAEPLGSDPVGSWDDAVARALDGVSAADLDATVHLSFGDIPGREYVMQLAADLLVHAWDLARATGQDERLDPDAVAGIAAWFDGTEPLYREAGVISDPVDVPPGADEQAALLARFGRDPGG